MRCLPIALVVVACSTPLRPSPPQPPPRIARVQPAAAPAPDPHNFGFEAVDGVQPKGWQGWKGAALATVTEDKRAGARSLRLDRELGGFTTLDAKPYAGKRVTLRGWVKTANSTETALWLRADAADGERLAFSNMEGRRISGTTQWSRQEVTIDVPANAATLVVGALQLGKGMSWFDELALDVGEIKPPAQIVLGGTVVDAAGAPAAGALVAVISMAGELEKHVRADASGRFELEVTEGNWGVSAQRAGAVGAFIAVTPYAATKRDLKITLGGSGGVVVRGKTSTKPKPGTVLRISPVSEFDADLFAVPVRDDGTFEVLLPKSDEYFVEELDGYARGLFKRTAGDVVDVVLETPSLEGPPAEVVTYLGKRGVALVSAEAGKGFADMEPLAKLIGKARIVALGEATHGSREIFQMKHRFLEYLVAKHGFTVFAIEANQPECRAINDYVLHGKGTARAALAGIYFWTWNTEEVLAMIEWMRAWNADPNHTAKVQFTGFDMQTSHVAHGSVAAFVERIAPASKGLLAPIAPLGEESSMRIVAAADAPARKAIADGLAALTAAFAASAKSWSKDPAFVDARHDLRILEQAFAMYTAKGGFDERDRAMAENVGWLLQQTKARIVVWAHNGHISNTLQAFANMGSHLRKKYKRRYLNIGFVFGEGSFQAIDFTKPSRQLAEHTLGPPPQHFLSTAFARTNKPFLVVDLRTLPKRIRAWFAQKRLVRELGAVFQGERGSTQPIVLPALYDAVIYIDKTTRARPLKK